MKNSILLLLSAVAAVSASCVRDPLVRTTHFKSLTRRQAEGTVPVSTFGYTDLKGPFNWYGLNKSTNGACAYGHHQSPIVIHSSTPYASEAINFNIPDVKSAKFENIGTNVEVVITNGTLWVGNKEYKLEQFHFHTPGEHRFFEEFYPMELHFVLQASDSTYAVVGFVVQLCTSDESNSFLNDVFANIDDIAIPGTYTETGPLSFGDIEAHLYHHPIYQYTGSLTTPPCTEGVNWLISNEPLKLDVNTYNKVKKIVKFNARYTANEPGKPNLLEVAAADFP